MGVGMGIGMGISVGIGMGFGMGIGMGIGVGIGMGIGMSISVGIGMGISVGISVGIGSVTATQFLSTSMTLDIMLCSAGDKCGDGGADCVRHSSVHCFALKYKCSG
ncbi:keratin, type II cytoskeletal I-like [Penaeus monodon]|uniref:keratin, type II cytoskeletal I-like n=1 Tax=Penaeus monodon TaxID=6687 RepID=UPI0018A7D6B7|nr:keratin, type II cytoskeletal I-like [Penaeus monodon]